MAMIEPTLFKGLIFKKKKKREREDGQSEMVVKEWQQE
jgi:hypothetical protein